MYGSLRFILALLVALSHLGITFYGYNFGVVAVVVFYLLAGMVSYKLLKNLYPNQPMLYYKDRVKRIFPLYLLVLVFTYTIYLFGASSYFVSVKPDFLSYISNITVVPLSYFMFSGIDKFTLIPPAWSLGVELQFYLLAPFVLLSQKRVIIFTYLSLLLFVLATIGVLHTDYYGYRLIAGVLFIFLTGALIQHPTPNTQPPTPNTQHPTPNPQHPTLNPQHPTLNPQHPTPNPLILIYTILICTSIYIYTTSYKAPYNHETLFALLIAIPLLKAMKAQDFSLPSLLIPLDKYLGRLSYAVFLLHFPVLWVVELYGYSNKNILLIMFLTIALSTLFIYLEKLFTTPNT